MTTKGRLDGKVAIITGASNGIGRATAVLFAREGARQVLAGMLDSLIAMFPGEGLRLAPFFLVHGWGDMALRMQAEEVPAAPAERVPQHAV